VNIHCPDVDVSTQVEAARAVHHAAAAWPYTDLDLVALRARGFRPTAFHDIVLKVHQRCNLACDYCYVYTGTDQSWRDRPPAMSDKTWHAAVAAVARHVERHGLTSVRIILHGGEPLLFGQERIDRLAAEIRRAMPAGCAVTIGMQTNGVLLTDPVIALLRRHGITVGVSVDGTAADHDRHRLTVNGRGSFASVRAALDRLRRPENRAAYAGVLCCVSPDTDPIATYEQLLEFEPPQIDFLLPHANWVSTPWRPTGSPTEYADWLIAVFDRWYASGSGSPGIRLFDDILMLLLGGSGRSEQVGISPSAVLVIESDGAIEQVDALKSAYPGACATGLDVSRDELDAALDDPGLVARQIGLDALSADCLQCPLHPVCGAGHYAHRYRAGTGFRNPSVYCTDMKKLIEHVRDRVVADVRATVGVS
jgi:uncharacterized protein